MPKPPSRMTRKQRTQLSAFLARKRRARRQRSTPTSPDLEDEDYAPVGFWFSPQRHGLTLEQCQIAAHLLRRANRLRPIRGSGKAAQFRRALRIAGIVSAVRNGRVGNTRWGRSMLGKRGGKVMALHGLHHLRAISPVGRQAAQAKREREQALQHWERTGQVLPVQPQGQASWPQPIDSGQGAPRDIMAW